MNTKKFLISILFGIVVFIAIFVIVWWHPVVANPQGWPSNVGRRAPNLNGQLKVIDLVSGKQIFSYDPELGYYIKSFEKTNDSYVVTFAMRKK